MKLRTYFLAAGLCLLTFLAFGADVLWQSETFTGTPLSNRLVYITPIANYSVSGSRIISGDRQRYTNDSTGSLIVSNVTVARSYRVEFIGPYVTTIITNSFPANVSGYVNAADFVAGQVSDGNFVGYSQATADSRFHKTSAGSSTNATFRGTLTIPEGASVGYVFTATNANGSGTWQPAASGVDAGLTNQWRADAAATTNQLKADIGSGSVPVPASALTGTIDDARLPATITSDITGTASGLDATGLTQARHRVHTNLFVTPQMFGATGDGSTDDTSALRQWLWFAGSNNVVAQLPPAPGGYYKITDTLTITNSVTIIGTGGQRHNPGVAATKSQIRQFGVGKSAIICTNYSSGYGSLHDNVEIRDLAITCDSSAYNYTDQFGIGFLGDASDQDNILCANLLVSGFGKGVGIVGMSASVFLNMDIADNGDNVYIGPYGANTATVINTILFMGGSCSHSYTNNWLVIDANQLTIDTMDNATTSGRNQYGYNFDSSYVIIRNVNVESSTAGKPFGLAKNGSKVFLEGGLTQLYIASGADTYYFVATNSTVTRRNHTITYANTAGFSFLSSSDNDYRGFFGDAGAAYRCYIGGGSTLWTNYTQGTVSTVFPSAMGTPPPTIPHQYQITDRVGGQANSTLYFTARFYSLLGNANVVAVDLLDWYKSKISTATVASFIATNTVTATNGYLSIELSTFPTNAIPLGTATKTNTAFIVYKGMPMTVATNRAVGGWMRWRTTDETWQAYTP